MRLHFSFGQSTDLERVLCDRRPQFLQLVLFLCDLLVQRSNTGYYLFVSLGPVHVFLKFLDFADLGLRLLQDLLVALNPLAQDI